MKDTSLASIAGAFESLVRATLHLDAKTAVAVSLRRAKTGIAIETLSIDGASATTEQWAALHAVQLVVDAAGVGVS